MKQFVIKHAKTKRFLDSFSEEDGTANTVESIHDAKRYDRRTATETAANWKKNEKGAWDDYTLEEYTYNHDPRTCFDQSNEEYIGSWFGHDVYEYKECGRKNLLATCGNEGGEYSTLVFDANMMFGTIGDHTTNPPTSILLCDYMTTDSKKKAFLMAAMVIYLRSQELK